MSFTQETLPSMMVIPSTGSVDRILVHLLEPQPHSGEPVGLGYYNNMKAVCAELNVLFSNMYTWFPKPSVLFPVLATPKDEFSGAGPDESCGLESPYYTDCGDPSGQCSECEVNCGDPRGPSYESIYGGVYVPCDESVDDYYEDEEEMVVADKGRDDVDMTNVVPEYVYDGYVYRTVDNYGVPIEFPPLYNLNNLADEDEDMIDPVLLNESLQEIQERSITPVANADSVPLAVRIIMGGLDGWREIEYLWMDGIVNLPHVL